MNRQPHPTRTRAVLLPLVYPQPHPLETLVARLTVGANTFTAITRTWDPADLRRCKLCPRCTVSPQTATCMVLTTAVVPERSAPLFPRGEEG